MTYKPPARAVPGCGHSPTRRTVDSRCRPPGRGRHFGTRMRTSPTAAVDLYWIPLGAGGHSVRFNGRVFEAIEAARQHRKRCDLYHSALVIELDGDRYTIEVAPSPNADEASRGVVAIGPVGSATSAGGACFATRSAAGAADRFRIWSRRSANRSESPPTVGRSAGCSGSSRRSPRLSGGATS